MTKIKNARPATAIAEQAAETAVYDSTAISRINFNSEAKKSQCVISDFLSFGAENAIDGGTLVKTLGYLSRRDVSKQIEIGRRGGQPICATNKGYYLADGPAELSEYVKSLDRRIAEIRKTRNFCYETLCRMYGQEIISEGPTDGK